MEHILKQIMIGIQARSTSTRLPGKSSFDLGSSTVIEHVIDRCVKSCNWLNRQSALGVSSEVYLLIPKGDPLKELRGKFRTVEGSEPDVLGRYVLAANECFPDYICRITGDCPLIPEFVISSIVKMAANGGNDYTSNTIPGLRTAIDGHDCEVISNRMLQWLDKTATTPHDREHVTTRIMDDPPPWARIHPVIGYYDLSNIKLSVDTEEDMAFVCRQFESVGDKIIEARKRGFTVGRL